MNSRSLNRILLCVGAAVLVPLSGCATRTIWESSRNGNLGQVRELLNNDPQLLNAEQVDQVQGDSNNHWTPLHYAVAHQHEKVVAYLLEQGADPLARARGGWTPLHAARQIDNRRIERMIVKAIVDSGRELP